MRGNAPLAMLSRQFQGTSPFLAKTLPLVAFLSASVARKQMPKLEAYRLSRFRFRNYNIDSFSSEFPDRAVDFLAGNLISS
jgi:hypothetical protein